MRQKLQTVLSVGFTFPVRDLDRGTLSNAECGSGNAEHVRKTAVSCQLLAFSRKEKLAFQRSRPNRNPACDIFEDVAWIVNDFVHET